MPSSFNQFINFLKVLRELFLLLTNANVGLCRKLCEVAANREYIYFEISATSAAWLLCSLVRAAPGLLRQAVASLEKKDFLSKFGLHPNFFVHCLLQETYVYSEVRGSMKRKRLREEFLLYITTTLNSFQWPYYT